MADELSQSDRVLSIQSGAGDDTFVAISFSGREAISTPFEFVVNLVSEDLAVSADKVLGNSATVQLKLSDDYQRYFNGVVWRFTAGAVSEVSDAALRYYQAELAPWTYFLKLSSNCRIFQNKTVPDIVEQVFKDGGFQDYQLSLNATYAEQEYCVQYNETDYDFCSRLMEEYGIFYYFLHEDGKHTLVLGDRDLSYSACTPGTIDFYSSFDDQTIGQLKSWSHQHQCTTGKVELRDYDFQAPQTSLIANEKTVVKTSATSALERYEYPGGFTKAVDGKSLATVRIEADEALYERGRGSGYHPGFQAGAKFAFGDHPVEAEQKAKYVLTAVEHFAEEPILFASGPVIGRKNGDAPVYWNQFECAPAKVAIRPARVTRPPVIHGPQSAVVVGPEGQEIYTDKFGRVKVQFHWDREGKQDENSSCWMRVAQSWAGGKFGAQFLPRVGSEVMVEYLNGDVDKPIITGSVFNGDNMPLYALPDNAYQSGWKTLSTDKGTADNYNELRFTDKIGTEEIYFHAERDFNRVVENNDTLKVGYDTKDAGDQTIDIYNNRTLTIDQGDETITLSSGSRVVTIEKDDTLTLKSGDHSLKVSSGQSQIEAAKSITLTVGGSSIKIDTQGVTITGAQISITGNSTAELKSPMTTVSSDGVMTVKGAMVKIN